MRHERSLHRKVRVDNMKEKIRCINLATTFVIQTETAHLEDLCEKGDQRLIEKELQRLDPRGKVDHEEEWVHYKGAAKRLGDMDWSQALDDYNKP